LGNGIAIPHGQPQDRGLILETGIAVLQVPDGVEWNPGEIAHLVVGIAAKSDEHLTEGAIPFAANDPIRVLPACIASSAVTGALSMLFNCTLRAPHGGIFVLAIAKAVGNVGLYIVAIAIGTFLTTITTITTVQLKHRLT